MKNIIIFGITYLGLAVGSIPGLAIDRTGIALLGAIAMVVSGAIFPADALNAIDYPTMLLLGGLMVISAQFRLGGFYSKIAFKITDRFSSPKRFLFILMALTGCLSALLTNDIVCLAFTPVITTVLLKKKINPVPFLIGLAISANIGSAATIIGNPQNMLIGQTGKLAFGSFSIWCITPVLASLGISYLILLYLYKNKFYSVTDNSKLIFAETIHNIEFNSHQSLKGGLFLLAVIILFFTSIPREITVMTAAGLLLCSRTMKTVELLELVDWQLITLFCGLFIVVKGITVTGLPVQVVSDMATASISFNNNYILTTFTVLLSNIVSNVPATMLIIPHIAIGNSTSWYVLALAGTFAGNLITIGSIANLITFQIAERYGIIISFREHAKAGIPVTLASLLLLYIWIFIAG